MKANDKAMKRALKDEQATAAFGAEMLAVLPRPCHGWTILLTGELGAGKSTFARALIQAAGHVGAIPSPTYTLIEPYELAKLKIYHIDLYRIADEEELELLGWNELDDGLRLIEWPERAPALTRSADLHLHLGYAGDGRAATLSALNERGRELIQKIN